MVDLAPAVSNTRGDAPGEEADGGIVVERRTGASALCRWSIPNFSKLKQKTLWSKYFDVGGYDCRLLVYPLGDSQALPGYVSIYLQVTDPGGASGKWDCFASYRLSVVNQCDDSKSVSRDSWHRFSAKKKSHGWCDFVPGATALDPKQGFTVNDTIVVTAEILILEESVSFTRENDLLSNAASTASPEVFSGKFTWKVHNFSLFQETIKTQKIMSPVFPAGECNLRLSVYQSTTSGEDYLSMCLESKDTEKSGTIERSCWCLFRMSVVNQLPGAKHVHRDSYGRFAADSRTGDNTSLGWNDYMKMSDFLDGEQGYVVDDTAVFSTTFHIIRESCSFSRVVDKSQPKLRGKPKGAASGDVYQGKFTWKIDNFTKLKDLLKKRKITGLCIKSKRFQVGGRDCRLIVYPRGQSQPPCHLSMFLEVTDARCSNADWSCFVSHRLSVVNQKSDDKSVTKESQNRYSKAAKDWGWREFVTLTSLFDQDACFLVSDTVVFAAEVLLLKETSEVREIPAQLTAANDDNVENTAPNGTTSDKPEFSKQLHFTWKIENFGAFKEIMETRKIFSRYFCTGGCDLRIGVYESFDTLCIYLESDTFGENSERNFWVKYKIAVVNQKHPEQTEWKESAICTKTWNNSVLQFMKVSEMVEPEAGYIVKDTLVLACEVLECCPWLEFTDLDVYASEDGEGISSEADELLDSEDSGLLPDDDDLFRSLLSRAGLHYGYGDTPMSLVDAASLQNALRDKLLSDPAAAAAFLTGLRLSLDDPVKMKRMLLPTICAVNGEQQTGVSLMNLLMGIKVLQPAIIDMVLDIMVACCRAYRRESNSSAASLETPGQAAQASTSASVATGTTTDGPAELSTQCPVDEHSIDRLSSFGSDASGEDSCSTPVSGVDAAAVQGMPAVGRTSPTPAQQDAGPSTSHTPPVLHSAQAGAHGNEWAAQSGELLGLIVSWLCSLEHQFLLSARTELPGQHGLPTVHKAATLLADAPRSLQPDIVMLVPKLVDPSEHTAVAGALLGRLAEASREGPEVEAELRMPVLAALGLLQIDPAVAEKVLRAALEALPYLSEAELPPAVGLVLKLASESNQSRGMAMRVVRERVRKAKAGVSSGTLDAMRLAMSQHPDVAQAMLADIDAECKAFKSQQAPQAEEADPDGNDLSSGSIADVEMLMDLFAMPALSAEAERIFERCVVKGMLREAEVCAVLERRRMQQLVASTVRPAGRNIVFGDMPVQSPGVPSPFPSLTTPTMESLHMGLNFPSPLLCSEDFEQLLRLCDILSQSKSARVKSFLTSLYSVMFRLYGDDSSRERMLRGLVMRAATSSAANTASTNRGNNKQKNKSTDEMAPDMVAAGEQLLSLVRQYHGCAYIALTLMVSAAQSTAQQIEQLQQQLREAEDEKKRAAKDSAAAVSKVEAERQRLSGTIADLQKEMEALQVEHKEDVASVQAEKKELQDKLRNLETEIEWMRGEHSEELVKEQRERKELQMRLKEADSQISRLKTQKREDTKRFTREKAQLADKLKDLEAALQRAEDTIQKERSAAASSRQESLRENEEAVRKHEEQHRQTCDELLSCKQYIRSLENKVRELNEYIHNLEHSVQEHMAVMGVGIDTLSNAELDALIRINEQSMKRIRSIQTSRARGDGVAGSGLSASTSLPLVQPGIGFGPPSQQLNHSNPLGSMGSLNSRDSTLGTREVPNSSGLIGLNHQLPNTSLFYGVNGGPYVTQLPGGYSGNSNVANGFGNGYLGASSILNRAPSSNSTHQLW